jgi:branched-chain amino acid transport system permease protein
MGSTTGAIFGVIALKLLDELVTIIGPILAAAVAPQAAASLALISHGLIIIVFLIFEPRGLHHRWEMVKNYFRLWPFSHEALE